MKFPGINEEVLVKLDTGNFAVAAFDGAEWFTGNGVNSSHEEGSYSLSGKVVEWTPLPEKLDHQLVSPLKNKP